MSIEDNTPKPDTQTTATASPAQRINRNVGKRSVAVGALLATLIVGAGAGALAMTAMHPRDQQTLLPPVAINAMKDDSLVAVKGQVAEIFGNKFVITDQTGRALVDTGRSGEGGGLVKQGEEVTAQGRFDNGFVHASMLAHSDGKVNELRAPPGPPRGPGGPGGHGPKWREWMQGQRADGPDAGPMDGPAGPPAP